jgi:carbohydrate-selective porin OprB
MARLTGGLIGAMVSGLAVCVNATGQDGLTQNPEQVEVAGQLEGEIEGGISWFGGRSWEHWGHATGDWGGLRPTLEDRGIEIGGGYIFDWSETVRGGLTDTSTYRSLLDVYLGLDLETVIGLPGGYLFMDYASQVGRNASEDVGDIQVFSNVDSENFHVIYALWWEQWLADDAVRLKVGKMDANEDFAYLEEGLVFIHSTPGFSPTVLAFPTYPDPAFGIVAFAYPTAGVYVGAGVYDGALQDGISTGKRGPGTFFSNDESSAYFWVGEAGYGWPGEGRSGAGRVALGAWHATGEFDRFDGGLRDGTSGYYFLAEQRVWREIGVTGEQGLAVMASYGEADEEVSDFAATILGGVTYTGLIEGRDHDVLGAQFSYADLSDVPSAGYPENETAYELFYKLQVTPAFALQPVLTYIVNPFGDPSIDNALLATLRGEIAF